MQKYWRGIAAGLGLLVAMETAAGSLPLAAWHVHLLDSEVIGVPTQPLRLTLPSDLPNHIRAALQFELDGVRITDGVTLLDDAAVYQPTQPLAPGTHRLRLEYAPANGRRRELGVWHFTVTAQGHDARKLMTTGQHAATTPFGGADQIELQITSSAVADGSPSTLPNADHLDVAPDKIIASLRTGSMLARVGPQELAYDSLIHKEQTHHGAVVDLEIGNQTRIKGFGVQSNEMDGYKRLLGSDRASYSLNGMVVEHHLPAQGGTEVNLVAGWLSGAAHAGGTDKETAQHAGNAWSMAADTTLLEQRLQLQFEYAGSRFDWRDASDGTEPVAADKGLLPDRAGWAYKFGTVFHSPKSSPINWHLGTKFDQVTPWFGSLANPTLTNDWRRLRTFGALSAGEWKFDLSLDQRQSNLEYGPATPTVQSEKGRFTAAWTPSQPIATLFEGKPSCELAAEYGRRDHIIAETTLESRQRNEQTLSLMLQTEFAHADGLWGVKAKGGKKPGEVDADESAGERTLELHLYGDIAAATLKPTVSWKRLHDEATGTTNDLWRAGLSSADIALSAYLKASVELAYKHRFRSDVGRGENGLNLGANFEWQLQRPAAGRSGLSLAVFGSYLVGDRQLAAPAGTDDYRFMVSLSASNPLESR